MVSLAIYLLLTDIHLKTVQHCYDFTVMKKAIVSPEYQATTRKHEVKKQIYAHHFSDFSLGAICSLTSAQHPVS